MISAPDKELKAIQDTIYHRILLSVNVHPAATGFRRQHSIVDNVRPHLGKRCVLKTDIHDFFISIRSPRVNFRKDRLSEEYIESAGRVVLYASAFAARSVYQSGTE